jgi:predicted transcriptional regulator
VKSESRAEEVRKAIELALKGGSAVDGPGAVELVMEALDKKKVFRYHTEDTVDLLSTAGKVLVVLLDDPTMTQRAISVYLDMSETMIDKTIKSLVSVGLITKTKVNRQNIYKVNTELILQHQDVQKFFSAISSIGKVVTQNEDDPF